MAGVKGRSGRRPEAERLHCRELIQLATTDEDWIKFFRTLAKRAREGSAAHAKLLLAYMFGQPTEQPDWLGAFEEDLARVLEELNAEAEAEAAKRLAPPEGMLALDRSYRSGNGVPSLPAKTE